MSLNCDLCNGLLEHVNISGGICTVCHHVHKSATSSIIDVIGAPRQIQAFSRGSHYDVETDSWGIACTYCEDIFQPEDMNNSIDRWLCNQCFSDHVLNE
jgi:predicted CXXCH cytochrome family protein